MWLKLQILIFSRMKVISRYFCIETSLSQYWINQSNSKVSLKLLLNHNDSWHWLWVFSSSFYISNHPGMFPLCSPPLWRWGSEHPSKDHPWSLSRLLLGLVVAVQIHPFTPVQRPTFIQSPRQPGSTLQLLDNRWHGLLLPSSAQQPQTHSKPGPSSVGPGRLSSAVSGRGRQRTAKPVSNGSRQRWHPSVLCGRTGGLGLDVPSWPL